nr:cytochrome P450 6k1-like [Onthophagus taurus]
MWFIIYLLSIPLIWFFYYVLYPIFYWKRTKIPYAGFSSAFYGLRALSMRISLGGLLWNVYDSSAAKAKVIGFHLFGRPCVVVKDLQVMKHILIKDYENFQYRTVEVNDKSDPIGSRVLFFLRNPSWELMRKKFSNTFTATRFQSMYSQMDFVGDNLLEYISDNSEEQISATDIVQKYSTDVITLTAFGIKANSFIDSNAISIKTAKIVFEGTFYRGVQFMSYFISPILTRIFNMQFIHKAGVDIVKEMIKDVGIYRKQNKIVKNDFIGTMLDMLENKTYIEGEKEIYGQGVQFWLAGFETIGSSLIFLLYELAHHQEIQERLRKEIMKTFEAEKGKISFKAIKEMEYLIMVTTESLRKYPILPFLDRKCINDYVIPDTDLKIDAGTNVYVSLLGVHYNPENFPNPFIFDPERFAKGRKGMSEDFSYLSFGAGRRHCIGLRLGKMSLMVAVVKILGKFRIHCFDKYSETKDLLDTKGFLLGSKKKILFKFEKL